MKMMSAHARAHVGGKAAGKNVDAGASTSMAGAKMRRASGKNDQKVTDGRGMMSYRR